MIARVGMVGDINGRAVTLRYAETFAAWFYDDSEVPPGTVGAKDYSGHWFMDGTGVAVEWEGVGYEARTVLANY